MSRVYRTPGADEPTRGGKKRGKGRGFVSRELLEARWNLSVVDGPAEIVPERGFYNVHKKKKRKSKMNDERLDSRSLRRCFQIYSPVDFDGFKFRHELNFKLFKSFDSLSEKKSSIFSTRKKRNGTRSIKKGKKSPDDKIESNAFKTWQRSIKTQINYDLFPSPTF